MTALPSRCPDPEALAAFVAGNLSGAELSMVAEHLRICEDCREIAGESALVDRDGVQLPVVEPHRRAVSAWWIAAAAAALAGLLFLSYRWGFSGERHGAMERLVAAAPRNARYVEARLTGGFPYAPMHSDRRSGRPNLDTELMKLIGVAGEVIEATQDDSTSEGRHAAAVAQLFAGNVKEADEILSAAATQKSDARVWSDLAAARYTAATQTGNAADLAQALAAADAALRLDAKLPEALFNRALILEHLGLRDQARTAWERYLATDPASDWANEARNHLRTLAPVSDFREELQRQYAHLRNDPEAARALALRYPQDARVWGETEILARWAEASLRGDAVDAEAHLRVARAFASTMAPRGDLMLIRAVDAITAADPPKRAQLANAHLRFREAQKTFRARQLAEAERLFVVARNDFEQGGSPIAAIAAYFRANTLYEQGRPAEARAILEQLMAADASEYPAHRAQVQWQLGLVCAAMGHWGDAIHALSDSVAVFERLQESGYADAVRDILAEVYDRLGQRRTAWRYRVVALRGISRFHPSRLNVALDAAARGAAMNREWASAVSLLGLQLEVLRQGDDPLLYVETLLDRARIQARLGEHLGSAADLIRASEAIDQMNDPSLRARAEADRLVVESLLVDDPGDALPRLSRAIEFHRVKGRRMFLPELLLQRGRAFASTGKDREAAQDFEEGIREIEAQRSTVAAQPRWGTFAVADELFDEAIGLAAKHGDARKAFAFLAKARMRGGVASTSASTSSIASNPDTVVIEYAALPRRLLILIVEGNDVQLVQREVTRAQLAEAAEDFVEAALEEDLPRFRRLASSLYVDLVGPVASDTRSAAKLVFVPDATLGGVPFAALIDGEGHYLLEQHAISVVPSLALRSRPSKVSSAVPSPRLLLVEGPPARAGVAEGLSYARKEADAVVAAYGTAMVMPRGSDRAAFERGAAGADVIHFIGHAIVPDDSASAALVTSSEYGAAGRLEAEEIAGMTFSRTSAVVLAACGTAQGWQRPGDTSISVAHAFLAAGVPSVVATLWPIDDAAAAEFFPRLHTHLARGRSPADAVRATQLEWIQRKEATPGMWAAVQTIGM